MEGNKEYVPSAIVGYSFGGSPCRPGPSNDALALVMAKAFVKLPGIKAVLDQDYLEQPLLALSLKPDLTVWKHRDERKFLDTNEVTIQYANFLGRRDITKVYIVAHPFLHKRKCMKSWDWLGFEVSYIDPKKLLGKERGKIPFDPEC